MENQSNYDWGVIFSPMKKLLLIMKISTFLLLVNLLSVAATSYGQNERFTIKKENAAIKDILFTIESQSKVKFLYRDETLENLFTSVNLEGAGLDETLNSILNKTGNTYQVLDNNLIVITPSSTVQQKKITGTVTDATTGEPIIGANAIIEGTTIGVVTDVDGKFTLEVPGPDAVITISFIGYNTERVILSGQSNLDVKLVPDIKSLEEVVVVGYGTQKKINLTGAISQITGEEAFQDRGVGNASVALQGEIPGLIVTRTSTRPGSEGAEMKIRGDISINGNSSPLVLIDGIAGSLDELNQMDPNDIENISALKDASAAIYGARSASGVLLVTTKRGKKGAAKITYNGSFSTSIDGIQPPITTNEQWLDMFYEAQYQDARASNPDLTAHDDIMKQFNWWIFNTGSVLSGIDANGKSYERDVLWKSLRNGETLTLKNSGKTYRYEPGHYLMDELYGQANWQKHSVSISGADEKFGYMASLGFADNNSQLKVAEDGEKKYSGRLNMDYQASKVLKFETGMSYEKRNITTPSTDVGGGYFDPWFWPVTNENGHYYDTFGNRNVVGGLIDGGQINTGFTTFRSNLKATLNLSRFLKGLSVSGTGGYKKVEKDIQTLKTKIQYYDWADVATTNRQSPGSLSEEALAWTNVTLGGFINYENKFSDLHNVSAMLGVTGEQEDYKRIQAARKMGPLYEGSALVDLDVFTSGTNNDAAGGQSSWAFLSYVTRLNYNYDGKYLVEFLGRRDGSSKLYPDQRWKNFYSIQGGWIISNENFMENISWLNNLKIRYNYGKTGSVEGINNYERFATISSGSSYFGTTLTAQPSLSVSGMTSSTRTWESIFSHNAGLDFGFLKNRLTGSFDYFVKTNDGMFISVTYPSILGTTAPKTNNGTFRTKGWEFSLDWKGNVGSVKYNAGGFISDYVSEVVKLENSENVPNPGKNSNRLVGKPRDAIYVYKTDGIFQTQEEANAYYDKYYWTDASHTGVKSGNIIPAPQTKGTNRLRPGARKLVDNDGDGAITTKDLTYAGDAAPHILFGIKAGLEWKGIDFQAFFQGVGKQVVLRTGNLYAPWVTNYVLQNNTFMGKMWSDVAIPSPLYENANLIDANTSADYTIASRDGAFNNWNYANKDVSVQHSSYLRLKTLVVGYTIPQEWTKKIAINKLRVYFSGEDIWEWTKIKDGYDPEHGEASNNTFPFSRLISFGLDVTF
jgi:TonB-linked SusC/RagA family outer membrane protein